MTYTRGSALVLAIVILFPARHITAANVGDFVNYSLLDGNNQVQLPGRLHVPAAYSTDPNAHRPLILYLHGGGQSGTDNLDHIMQPDLNNLLVAAKRWGAFLYAPQTNSGWSSSTVLSRAMTMIDRAIAERQVDRNRIYITGISMGGGGVWNFLDKFSDRFAAAVPICAISPSADFQPANVVNEPIWAFHGRADSVVSAMNSRDVINRLLSEAHQPRPSYPALNDYSEDFEFDDSLLDLHYTEYRNSSHVIWSQVYAYKPIYVWMFARTSVPEPATGVTLMLALASMCLRRRFTSQRLLTT